MASISVSALVREGSHRGEQWVHFRFFFFLNLVLKSPLAERQHRLLGVGVFDSLSAVRFEQRSEGVALFFFFFSPCLWFRFRARSCRPGIASGISEVVLWWLQGAVASSGSWLVFFFLGFP